ncbi:hypothetical protein [Saccharothrix sp.]|uniref:hypothetical protein n=1 Tax=Saccharothrix sp. TaxID=1873460 RepID=UPI002811D367|nr:hypothetical protein [Saccharothrix sp.]
MIRYLGSTKNLVGCVGGLIGVVLYVTGVVGSWWPAVVAGLYAVGALLAPPEKVRLVPKDAATEAWELRAGLSTLVREVAAQRSRMPESTMDSVRRVVEVLDDMLGKPERLTDPDLRHNLVRLARTDLPLSVQTYLNLPWWLSAQRKADEELVAQLGLLEGQARQLAERFYASDVNRQTDHGRYLRDQNE